VKVERVTEWPEGDPRQLFGWVGYNVTDLPEPNGVCSVCGDPTYDLGEHGSVCAMAIRPYPLSDHQTPEERALVEQALGLIDQTARDRGADAG
jgi:hypothetical protein